MPEIALARLQRQTPIAGTRRRPVWQRIHEKRAPGVNGTRLRPPGDPGLLLGFRGHGVDRRGDAKVGGRLNGVGVAGSPSTLRPLAPGFEGLDQNADRAGKSHDPANGVGQNQDSPPY